MSGEIIRRGDPTSHMGTVMEGSLTDLCHGKPIAYIGHKVHCPKCNGTFPIIEGVITTTLYGKGVAIAGMKTACGAVLIPTQFTDTVETGGGAFMSGTTASAAATAVGAAVGAALLSKKRVPERIKKVTRLSWSYGEEAAAMADKSRFHVDLNLHVETENYADGEKVDIVIENDDGSDVVTGVSRLAVQGVVGNGGKATIKNVFAGKTVDISASV